MFLERETGDGKGQWSRCRCIALGRYDLEGGAEVGWNEDVPVGLLVVTGQAGENAILEGSCFESGKVRFESYMWK